MPPKPPTPSGPSVDEMVELRRSLPGWAKALLVLVPIVTSSAAALLQSCQSALEAASASQAAQSAKGDVDTSWKLLQPVVNVLARNVEQLSAELQDVKERQAELLAAKLEADTAAAAARARPVRVTRAPRSTRTSTRAGRTSRPTAARVAAPAPARVLAPPADKPEPLALPRLPASF